jgi:hypothetical protein
MKGTIGIVFEFAESGLPGYRIEYTDRPVQKCGSGEAVSVRGDARMLIQIQPANAHTQEGGSQRIRSGSGL